MRAVRNFDDAKLILSELMSWKDKLETKDWNFTGKRIRNASPSIDENDYVVRKELPTILASDSHFFRFYTAMWECTGDITVGDDAAPPYIVSRANEGLPIEAYIAAVSCATDIHVQITINGVSFCAEDIILPAGQTVATVFTGFNTPVQRLQYLDILNINVISGEGSKVSVALRVRRINA